MRNKYFLLRHGQTIYQTKKKGLIYPWPDFVTELTREGKKQIEVAAGKLKGKKIDLIYSSDFLRTRETAKIVAKEFGLKVKTDKRLRDINPGIYQGESIKKHSQFFTSRKQEFSKRPPKGENWRDVKKRIKDFLKEVEEKHKGKTILVVTHGDTLWILAGVLKGFNEKELLETRYEGFRPYKDFYPYLGQVFEII